MKELVSIVIPCYNSAQYLDRCFQSVVSQTYGLENLEVVFVDDASTDDTPEILSRIQKENPAQVRVIMNARNQGPGVSRNIGMDAISGTYLMFIDADDYVDSTIVEKMVEKIAEHDCDMVQGMLRAVYDGGAKSRRLGEDELIDLNDDVARRLYLLNNRRVVSVVKLYRTEYLNRYGIRFPAVIAYEDVFFTGIIMFSARKIYCLNEELYFYYQSPSSIMRSQWSWDKGKAIVQIFDSLEACLIELGLFDWVREYAWGEYQSYVVATMVYDPSARSEMWGTGPIAFFSSEIATRFPNILSNVYITGSKSQNIRECVDYLFHHAEELGLDWRTIPTMVHVCLCVHDRTGSYTHYAAAAALSVARSTERAVCFHVLCDGSVSGESRELFRRSIGGHRAFVEFHDVDVDSIACDNKELERYSIGSLFRLLIPDMLPDLHRVIYLDADIMANCDIGELWDTQMRGCPLAGVQDIGFSYGILKALPIRMGQIRQEDYVNSGVLLMDTGKIRESGGLLKGSLEYFESNPDSLYPDQDALNVLFKDNILLLDEKWNVATEFERPENSGMRDAVYHYRGDNVRWTSPTEFDKEYLRLRQATAWGYGAIESDIMRGMDQAYHKVGQLQKAIAAIQDGRKTRVFCGKNVLGMRSILQIIPLREGDYYIGHDPVVGKDGMRFGFPEKEIEDLEAEERGTFVVFTMADTEYLQAMHEMGLEKGEDFFVIPTLLTIEQGGYLA